MTKANTFYYHKNMALEIILQNVDVNLGQKKILRNILWGVKSGEIHIIQGDNGAGKTTFLKLLAGKIWPTQATYRGRTYIVNGQSHHNPAIIKDKIKLVCPEDYNFYVQHNLNLKILDVVLSGLNNSVYLYTQIQKEDLKKAASLLELFGLSGLQEKRFLTLSSGQAQKVLIARALMGEPQILLLDEPGANLDHKSRTTLFSILRHLVTQNSCAIVCTTHYSDIPLTGANFWEIKNSQIRPKSQYPETNSNPEKFAQTILPPLKPENQQSHISNHFQPATVIQVHNVIVQRNNKVVLDDIHFQLKKGDTWAILGENGSGKSTFLRLLLGEIHPLPGGDIKWWGKSKISLWELRQKIGFVSPELRTMFRPETTVFELVASGLLGTLGICRNLTEKQKNSVLEWLHKWKADTLTQRPIHTLSSGQLQKALLLRALINNPKVLLLDEPLTGLDEKTRYYFLSILKTVAEDAAVNQTTALVMSTHYPQEVQHFISKGIILNQGRIVYQGNFKESINAWLNQGGI